MRTLLAALLAAAALTGCGDDSSPRDEDMIAAARAGDVDQARSLIEQGADVNAKDAREESAYLIATVNGNLELLELTLRNGADVNAKDSYNGTGLIRAADAGQVEVVRRLLRAGIDKDHVNELGWTALLEAVILGDGDRPHTEIVRVLVDGGVDTSIRDREGNTALDIAEDRGYDGMVRILRDAR